ncbi:hypothetical protein AAA539_20005 [Pseudomonas aeruginosa]
MSKHTPGPWVRCAKSPKIIMSGSIIEGYEGYMIGSVTGNDNSGFYAAEDEAEANARLMAAAPEMLGALQHIEEYWNRDSNEQAMTDALWHIIETAQAAIAKATA